MPRRIPWQELSSCSSTTATRALPYTGIACISMSHPRTMPNLSNPGVLSNMSHSRILLNMSHPGTMSTMSNPGILPNTGAMPYPGTMSHLGTGKGPLCRVSLYEWRDMRKHSRWELHLFVHKSMDWTQL